MVHVAPVKSTDFPSRGISAVTVRDVVNAQFRLTSSCGNGTRDVQLAAVDQEPPDVFVQVCVVGVVKVIPLLPPQSQLPPEIADKFQEPAHAHIISWKSAFVTDTVAADNVYEVPSVSEQTNKRFTVELPLIVRVPVTVLLPLNRHKFVLTAVQVIVKVAKVLAPEIRPDELPILSVTILYVKPHHTKISAIEPLAAIVEVLTVIVKFVIVPSTDHDLQLMVLDHKVTPRTTLAEVKRISPTVTVWLLVFNVPFWINRVPVDFPVKVSCKVHPPHIPSKYTKSELRDTPAIVIVFPVVVALNVIAPVYVLTKPLYKVILPDIVIATDQAHVTLPEAGAQKVKSRQSFVVASIVTV